ncbi:MAG: cob(I)yrinic acid a,c-diamide adenosyltransferase [Acidimicrobiia bacterium]
MSDTPPVDDPRTETLQHVKSLVLVFTGDGKGKSSAAFAIMIRAVARDWKVAVVQYLKSGRWNSGEERIGDRLGVDWFTIGEGFTWESSDLTKDEATAQLAWTHSKAVIDSGDYDVVILDEVTYPMNWGWIDGDEVVETITNRPANVNVVCTGRNAPASLIDIADTVTEMRKVKHPFDRNIAAKKGIDF